jgi:hypothetical protein
MLFPRHNALIPYSRRKTGCFRMLFPDPFSSFRREAPEPLSREPSLSLYCVLSASLATGMIALVHLPTQTLEPSPQHVSLAVQKSPTATQNTDG